MIRTEPNYRDIADAVGEIDEQIKALQDAKKDIYGKVRDDHGKKIADQLKLAIKLNVMEPEKRMERDEIEEGAFRILSIIQAPRAPRATRTREIIEEFRPADGGANITMTHRGIATDVPHDSDGVIIEFTAEPEAAAEVAGNDLREPMAAASGQIIREGDAPRETDCQAGEISQGGSDASRPDTELRSDQTSKSTAVHNGAGNTGVTAGETAKISHSVAPPPPGDADQAGAALVPAAPAAISSPACTAADDGQPSIPSSDALAAGPGAVPEGYAKSEQAVSLSDADVPAFLKTGKAA